jgi:hypothetical protein
MLTKGKRIPQKVGPGDPEFATYHPDEAPKEELKKK